MALDYCAGHSCPGFHGRDALARRALRTLPALAATVDGEVAVDAGSPRRPVASSPGSVTSSPVTLLTRALRGAAGSPLVARSPVASSPDTDDLARALMEAAPLRSEKGSPLFKTHWSLLSAAAAFERRLSGSPPARVAAGWSATMPSPGPALGPAAVSPSPRPAVASSGKEPAQSPLLIAITNMLWNWDQEVVIATKEIIANLSNCCEDICSHAMPVTTGCSGSDLIIPSYQHARVLLHVSRLVW